MDSSNAFLLLIEPEARSGSWNMAVDEALLEAARLQQLTAIRFYRWHEPTLSLGYFQKSLPGNLPAELKTLTQVRRLSGGGAILHHLEWTYSCVIPPSHPLAGEPLQLYEIVHREFTSLLNEQHIPATLRGPSPTEKIDEPFLCFGREDPRDIVLGHHKIVGSAQRRRRGAVLQHGSLLLERSPHAPEYAGLCDLAEDDLPINEWIPQLTMRIGHVLGASITQTASELPESIAQAAGRFEREKYRFLSWR